MKAKPLHKKMFMELAKDSQFLTGMLGGYGFSILPNPDSVIKDKGLRYDAWKDLLNDSHLAGALDARKASVKGMQWKLSFEATENSAANQIIESVFTGANVATLINGILDCLLWGFQPIEIVWAVKNFDGKTYTLPKKFNALPPNLFGFNSKGELCEKGALGLNAIVADERKIICPRYEATALNPYGTSLLSRCYWPVNWKRGVRKFWVDYLERFGFPNIKIGYDLNKTTEEITDAINVIAASLQDSVFAISNDYTLDIINNAGSGTSEIFEQFLQSCDDEISKAILGHTGSMRSEAGKLGNENVATDSKWDKKLSDKRLIEDTVNGIIALIYEQNFPTETSQCFFVMYDEEDVGLERANLDSVLYGMGVRFSDKYIQDTYDLPEYEFWQLEKRPTATEVVASSSTIKGTVGGIQVVASLVAQYEANTLSRDAAIALAEISFGYTNAEAERLFPLRKPTAFAAQQEPEFIPDEKVLQELGDNLTSQIMDAIEKAESLEDALQRVAAIYPELDSEKFVQEIERLYMANLIEGALSDEA